MCQEYLPIEKFSKFSTADGGRRNTCSKCAYGQNKIRQKLKQENPAPKSGHCPICGDYTDEWVLDHCHTSHEFRGYICNACNLGLGKFKDDPAIVKKALDYLSTTLYATQDQKQITISSEEISIESKV